MKPLYRLFIQEAPKPSAYRAYQTPKGALKEIDLSAQPNGIYLYRVITETGSLVGEGKFIIQK